MAMRKKKENIIENYLVKRCKELNIFILKNTGMKGIPDRLILKNGVYIWIETKRPGETPSEIQKEIIRRLKLQKAIVYIADNKTEIDRILEEITKEV